MLYDTLTVQEHLWFFGRLKGLTRQEAGGEIDKMMESIKLADKSNAQTRFLSGGMKRKLSLGLALIGKAKVSSPGKCLRQKSVFIPSNSDGYYYFHQLLPRMIPGPCGVK